MMQLGLALVAYDKLSGVVDNAMGRVTRSLSGVQAKAMEVSRKMAEIGTGASMAGHQIMDAMRTPLGAFAEQEQALSKLEMVFMDSYGKIPAALAETKRQVVELGNTNPGTDAIFANTAVALRKQGMALEDINNGALKAAAALAITLDKPAQEMAEMVGKLREGFGLAGSELPKMADIIQRTSIGFGVDPESMRYALQYAGSTMRALHMEGAESAKQFLTIQGLMQQRGVEGSVFGTNFAQMVNQAGMLDTKLMRHSAIMKEVNKDLADQGIKLQFFNEQGKFAGMENFISQLEKLKTLTDKERLTVLNRLFGMEGARTAIQLMEIGNEGLRKGYAVQEAQANITDRNNKMLGTTLNLWIAFTGTMRNLFAALGGPAVTALKPLLDSINLFAGADGPLARWVHRNQELVKWVGLLVLGGGVLLVGLGGLGIVLSFVARGAAMTIGGFGSLVTCAKWLGSCISLLGPVFSVVGRIMMARLIPAVIAATQAFWAWGVAMMATPVGWVVAAIVAIAAGAYLIWRNWDTIKAWFSAFWSWLTNLFSQMVSWFMGLGSKFVEAGSNIMTSLWQGISSKAQMVIDKVKEIAGKVRGYFPFSPAKEGPLRDIHRIKLIETIAASIKPGSLVKAISSTVAAAQLALAPLAMPAMAMPNLSPAKIAPAAQGAAQRSAPITIHFSPQVTVHGQSGDGTDIKGQVMDALKKHEHELVRMIEDVQRRYGRRAY
jgi:TP901 family phage tail tape measure protein